MSVTRKISMVGIGRLGLCTALQFSRAGFDIMGMDARTSYIGELKAGVFESYEPGVNEALSDTKMQFTDSLETAVDFADLIFILVPTPENPDTKEFYDETIINQVLQDIVALERTCKHLVVMCTVMPGFHDRYQGTLPAGCTLSYNPEFIAQGSIMRDLVNPDIVLIGQGSPEAGALIADTYRRLVPRGTKIFTMPPLGAEIAKIGLNGYVTSKLSYANMIGDLCTSFGATTLAPVVLKAIGTDTRIGNRCFRAGYSFGGPCFPRDTQALEKLLQQQGVLSCNPQGSREFNDWHTRYQADALLATGQQEFEFTHISYKESSDINIIEHSAKLRIAAILARRGRRVTIRDVKDLVDLTVAKYGNLFSYQVAKRILVCGAGGFIGGKLCEKLHREGHFVTGVDIKPHAFFDPFPAAKFVRADLRRRDAVESLFANKPPYDEVYQLAADMGGADFVFTGTHDLEIMHNSALVNLNMVDACVRFKARKVFFSSSACVYPEENQLDPQNPVCTEASAYPANPDSEYGWEKLFAERLYFTAARTHNLQVRVARFHNIFGPQGCWCGGREKAPAALCRKVLEAEEMKEPTVEIYGTGTQTRSFLYIGECLEGIARFMDSDFQGPLNIGSEEMVTINGLVEVIEAASGIQCAKKHILGPLGVNGRNSDNRLIRERLGWAPSMPLEDGIRQTLAWIRQQRAEQEVEI